VPHPVDADDVRHVAAHRVNAFEPSTVDLPKSLHPGFFVNVPGILDFPNPARQHDSTRRQRNASLADISFVLAGSKRISTSANIRATRMAVKQFPR
jgi:hypothetical protein